MGSNKRRYTCHEDDWIVWAYTRRVPINYVARTLGRSKGSIYYRAVQLRAKGVLTVPPMSRSEAGRIGGVTRVINLETDNGEHTTGRVPTR